MSTIKVHRQPGAFNNLNPNKKEHLGPAIKVLTPQINQIREDDQNDLAQRGERVQNSIKVQNLPPNYDCYEVLDVFTKAGTIREFYSSPNEMIIVFEKQEAVYLSRFFNNHQFGKLEQVIKIGQEVSVNDVANKPFILYEANFNNNDSANTSIADLNDFKDVFPSFAPSTPTSNVNTHNQEIKAPNQNNYLSSSFIAPNQLKQSKQIPNRSSIHHQTVANPNKQSQISQNSLQFSQNDSASTSAFKQTNQAQQRMSLQKPGNVLLMSSKIKKRNSLSDVDFLESSIKKRSQEDQLNQSNVSSCSSIPQNLTETKKRRPSKSKIRAENNNNKSNINNEEASEEMDEVSSFNNRSAMKPTIIINSSKLEKQQADKLFRESSGASEFQTEGSIRKLLNQTDLPEKFDMNHQSQKDKLTQEKDIFIFFVMRKTYFFALALFYFFCWLIFA